MFELAFAIQAEQTKVKTEQVHVQIGSIGSAARGVYVPGYRATLTEGSTIRGAAELPSNANQVRVSILNEKGELVRQLHLGPQEAGRVHFDWDGTTNSGRVAKPGTYLISVQGLFENQNMELSPMIYTNVDIISLNTYPTAPVI